MTLRGQFIALHELTGPEMVGRLYEVTRLEMEFLAVVEGVFEERRPKPGE